MQLFLDSYPVQDAPAQLANIASCGMAAPPDLLKANRILNPLGQESARCWLLVLRQHLNAISLDADHTLTLIDDFGNTLKAFNLVFIKATNLTPSVQRNDPSSCYLVELTDHRWLLHNPTFSVPANKQYNVLAPAYGGQYYAASMNSGSPWTWSGMIGDLWALMANQLGYFPGLPITPDDIPHDYKFPGVPAWPALCRVLYQLGCAVYWNPMVPNGQYTIVKIGAADSSFGTLQLKAGIRLIHDSEILEGTRTKFPAGVRVHFHRVEQHHGTEQTTPQGASQWASTPLYTVDIPAPTSITGVVEPGILHPLWDDEPAVFDAISGTITAPSAAACALRAANVAGAFYAMLQAPGGDWLKQSYDGLVGFTPGSTLKGVAWYQDGQGSLVTEIVRHPLRFLRPDDHGHWQECEDSNSLHAPDLRPTVPVYPHLVQQILVNSSTPDSEGKFDASVEQFDPVAGTTIWHPQEAVWLIDPNGSNSFTAGQKYGGRLSGFRAGRPVYSSIGSAGGTPNVSKCYFDTLTFQMSSTPGPTKCGPFVCDVTGPVPIGNGGTYLNLSQYLSLIGSPINIFANTLTVNVGTTSELDLNVSGNYSLSGFIPAGVDGQLLIIVNVGTGTLTLKNQDAAVLFGYRIVTPDGLDYQVPPNTGVLLKYVLAQQQWYIVSNQFPTTSISYSVLSSDSSKAIAWRRNPQIRDSVQIGVQQANTGSLILSRIIAGGDTILQGGGVSSGDQTLRLPTNDPNDGDLLQVLNQTTPTSHIWNTTWNSLGNIPPPPSWNHNLLSARHPDTLIDNVAVGDLLIGNSTPNWARLPGNPLALRKFAMSVNTAPVVWARIQAGDVDGILGTYVRDLKYHGFGGANSSFTSTAFTVAVDEALIVAVFVLGTYSSPSTCSWNGRAMIRISAASQSLTGGVGRLDVFWIGGDGSNAALAISNSSPWTSIAVSAEGVRGLVQNIQTSGSVVVSAGATADSGSVTASNGRFYEYGVIAINGPVTDDMGSNGGAAGFTWNNNFIDGGNTAGNANIKLTTAWKQIYFTDAAEVKATITPHAWAAATAIFF